MTIERCPKCGEWAHYGPCRVHTLYDYHVTVRCADGSNVEEIWRARSPYSARLLAEAKEEGRIVLHWLTHRVDEDLKTLVNRSSR